MCRRRLRLQRTAIEDQISPQSTEGFEKSHFRFHTAPPLLKNKKAKSGLDPFLHMLKNKKLKSGLDPLFWFKLRWDNLQLRKIKIFALET